MNHYERQIAVGACDVDLVMLQEIDQCLTAAIQGSTVFTLTRKVPRPTKQVMPGRPGGKAKSGKQIFSSVREYGHGKIADGTSKIELERKAEDPDSLVKLTLSSSSIEGKNQLLICFAGAEADARGPRLSQTIEAILNNRKAITRFVHSAFAYPLFVVLTLLPVSYLARDIIREFGRLEIIYSLGAATLYSFICVFMIRQFIPFCVFDSQANSKTRKTAGLIAGGIGTVYLLLLLAGA